MAAFHHCFWRHILTPLQAGFLHVQSYPGGPSPLALAESLAVQAGAYCPPHPPHARARDTFGPCTLTQSFVPGASPTISALSPIISEIQHVGAVSCARSVTISVSSYRLLCTQLLLSFMRCVICSCCKPVKLAEAGEKPLMTNRDFHNI